jgi:hypothetical protein
MGARRGCTGRWATARVDHRDREPGGGCGVWRVHRVLQLVPARV